MASALYGNPLVVRTLLKHRDPRMGVCMDAGWITSTGMDPTKVFKEYEGRVYDIHLKDKKVEKTVGEDVATDTQIGEGQGKFGAFIGRVEKDGLGRDSRNRDGQPELRGQSRRIRGQGQGLPSPKTPPEQILILQRPPPEPTSGGFGSYGTFSPRRHKSKWRIATATSAWRISPFAMHAKS